MTRIDRTRTRRKIEHLRFKATLLLAKNAVRAPYHHVDTEGSTAPARKLPKIRGTKPAVLFAERYFAQALALELGLKLREEATKRERRNRETQAREITRGVRKVWRVGA